MSIYWLTGTAGPAAQIYYEAIAASDWTAGDLETGAWDVPSGPATVPTGVLVSAHDVTVRPWAERDFNVVRWTELDRGGHFLSMEEPQLFVEDVRAFFAEAV